MKIKKWDLIFITIGILVVFVLAIAPKQTTPRVPNDEIHSKLVDETTCKNCHGPGTDRPLPANHPNKERCLLCHKRKK